MIDIQKGQRARYRVPVRGGEDLSYGDVLKVNRKTVLVNDLKRGCEALVDKELVFDSFFLEPIT